MDTHSHKDTLKTALSGARRKMFAQSATVISARTALVALPVAALVIAIDQRWGGGGVSLVVGAIAVITIIVSPLFLGLALLGTHFRSAVHIDDRASLKNRISSAWHFLDEGELDEPRRVQVKDAIDHATALNYGALFSRGLPGAASVLLPLVAAAFILSFLVPAYAPLEEVQAGTDLRSQYQLGELRLLEEAIEGDLEGAASEELEEVLDMLREMEEQFEEGELEERDVMIQLARMDEEVARKMEDMGVQNLEGEVDSLAAPFTASAAGADVGAALQEGDFSKASQALKELSEKMGGNELSPEEMAQLSENLEKSASEFEEQPDASTFKGDVEKAAEALKQPDPSMFDDAVQSMGKKLVTVEKLKKMKNLRNSLQTAKLNLGQAPEKGGEEGEGGPPTPSGFEQGKAESGQGAGKSDTIGKGGLDAGKGKTGSAFGDASRLADSYRELLKIKGMMGKGPTETETEYGETEDADSELSTKDIYAEYAAVAEQAIDREEIPLSHRFHVKRYFQAIKPVDEE